MSKIVPLRDPFADRPTPEVSRVMSLVRDRLDDIERAIPPRYRPYFAEALLRLAADRASVPFQSRTVERP